MNVRKFGKPPITVVVVHGGPGAPGEMKPVAEELSKFFGVLEPLQSADTVVGQVEELKTQIEENAQPPIYLFGYSWGAWLSYLVAGKYPKLIEKLILISSGPFKKSYAEKIIPTRMSRLSSEERKKVETILKSLQNGDNNSKTLKEFGALMSKADSFDPLTTPAERSNFQPKIYKKVWNEADQLRSSGELLKIGQNIRCPVVAIHGDFDPHPFEGVKEPLSCILKNFHFILIKDCGHTPWREKKAKERFYEILKLELAT